MAKLNTVRNSFQERIGVGERQPTSAHAGTDRHTVVKREDMDAVAAVKHERWDGRVGYDVQLQTQQIGVKTR